MEKQNRVLAYNKALVLTDEELVSISGGSSIGSCQRTWKVTSSLSGSADGESDQIWD